MLKHYLSNFLGTEHQQATKLPKEFCISIDTGPILSIIISIGVL